MFHRHTLFFSEGVIFVYEEVVQKSIAFIEQHLDKNLSLDVLAKEMGFSKFHFHRIFKKYVGKNTAEYIHHRKIAYAANLLLYTGERILDIALLTGFESQEAFTRSFKKSYGLPPAKYREQMRAFIKQEEEMAMSEVKGWLLTGSHPEKYTLNYDTKVYRNGNKSVVLHAKEGEHFEPNQFATLMQQFQAKNYLGKRVRFSGFIKTEDVTGWSGLWMRIDDSQQNLIGFDNMETRSIKGTKDWNYYACVLDVPQEADCLNIGMLLTGHGHVWLDDCSFEEVGLDIPVTGSRNPTEKLPAEPQNLKFTD